MAELSEREIEDWVQDDVKSATGDKGAFLLGRQVVLPSGRRVDLLAASWGSGRLRIYVIEIKARSGTFECLGQLVGYMDEARRFWSSDSVEIHGILLSQGSRQEVQAIANHMPNVLLVSFDLVVRLAGHESRQYAEVDLRRHPEGGFAEQFQQAIEKTREQT